MYKCLECKAVFDEPKLITEDCTPGGVNEGGSFNKIMYVCPICEGEYDFAHKCDICDEYYTTFELHYNPDNKSYICDKCENEMEEFK